MSDCLCVDVGVIVCPFVYLFIYLYFLYFYFCRGSSSALFPDSTTHPGKKKIREITFYIFFHFFSQQFLYFNHLKSHYFNILNNSQDMSHIFNHIHKNGICGVIILSGDAHYGMALRYVFPDKDNNNNNDNNDKNDDNNNINNNNQSMFIWEFGASPFQAFPFPLPNLPPSSRGGEWTEERYFLKGNFLFSFSFFSFFFYSLLFLFPYFCLIVHFVFIRQKGWGTSLGFWMLKKKMA